MNLPLELTQRETVAVRESTELVLERHVGQTVSAFRDRDSAARKEVAYAALRWAERVLDGEIDRRRRLVEKLGSGQQDANGAFVDGTDVDVDEFDLGPFNGAHGTGTTKVVP